MKSHNAANERIKRQYFAYLGEALGHSEQTIDAVAKAIARFEAYTRYKMGIRTHLRSRNGYGWAGALRVSAKRERSF